MSDPCSAGSLLKLCVWLERLPLFAMAGAVSVVTHRAQQQAGAAVNPEAIGRAERLANAVWSYLTYLGHAIWPSGLAAFYPHLEGAPPAWRVAVAVVVPVGVTGALWWLRRQAQPQLVGWLWYLETLVPVIGLVQVGTHIADRYMYVPPIGIFVALAWTGDALVRRGDGAEPGRGGRGRGRTARDADGPPSRRVA